MAALGPLLGGCASHLYDAHPCTRADLGGCLIEDVRVAGNHEVGSGDIEDRIATAKDHRAIGGILKNVPILSALDRLTVDYERLDPFVLDRDLARVERYYHARGYYEAHVFAGRVTRLSKEAARVEIVVDEGTPVRIAERPKDAAWPDWKDRPLAGAEKVTTAVTDVLSSALTPGSILVEDEFEATKRVLLRAMTDHGFPYASVEGSVDVDLVKHLAVVTFHLGLGPHATFGEVKMVGNGALPAAPMLAALTVKKGRDFSTAALESAEITLADFGVFGSIQAVPELAAPGQPRSAEVPVTIRVQPAALRAVRVGVGAQVGGIVEAHGVVGWEDHNLFGGLRRFTVEGRPGIVFYPKTFDTLFSASKTDPSLAVLPELRLRFDFRQPALFGAANLTWIVRGAFNHYRLPTTDPLDDVGYNEIAGSTGLERAFWNTRVYIGAFMNLQYDAPFAYLHPEPPVGYQKVVIPYAQAIATLDLRRGANGKVNKVDPHSGFYFGLDLQGAFGDARDVRVRPEVRAYAPITKKVTLAFRLTGGFLFPFNYPNDQPTQCGVALTAAASNPATVQVCDRDRQLLQFRGFFSGGANSNRGYGYNGVGPRELTTTAGTSSTPATLTVLGTGGLTLWESSLELRIPIVDKLGSSIFLDASDVRFGEGSFSLLSPHLSAGFGIRYQTPVGPLRGDFGLRVPCAQTFEPGMPKGHAGCPEDASAHAATDVFGLPLGVSIAIGEAF